MTRQEILRSKAEQYLNTVTPEELIKDFEEMGVELDYVEYKETIRTTIYLEETDWAVYNYAEPSYEPLQCAA